MYQTLEPIARTMMSTAQILAYLGISRSTFCRWVRTGFFPPPAFAPSQRLKLWRQEDVLEWVRQQSPTEKKSAPSAAPSSDD